MSLAEVLLSSASNMYFASSSQAADLTTRVCLFPSVKMSNLSSAFNSWVPFSHLKAFGSRDISHSNFASSFSYTCTSLKGVRKVIGSSRKEKYHLCSRYIFLNIQQLSDMTTKTLERIKAYLSLSELQNILHWHPGMKLYPTGELCSCTKLKCAQLRPQ